MILTLVITMGCSDENEVPYSSPETATEHTEQKVTPSLDFSQLPYTIERAKDIVYGYAIVHSDETRSDLEEVALRLDVCHPAQDTRTDKPLLIYIHGGGAMVPC
jgi:carboxylesterase type B